MFEKSLNDVIRGIRANKDNVDEYVQACINECRKEVAVPNDPAVNANAVLKLAYFHMMGYDMSWASFHVLKVMSMPLFWQKWIGYLAASVSFTPKTDVLMLTTNLIKKDLNSNSHFDTCVAVACLSEIMTADLAGDLAMDLVNKLNHFNAYTRRRILLAVYRMALVYPDVLEMAMDRLTARLDPDEERDASVVSCAVSVICELASANPQEYIALAPQLFGLLTSVSNNWMLIKLVKMFQRMALLEPRLVRKLSGPMTDLIATTTAMSLLYECIVAAVAGKLTDPALNPTKGIALAKLCLSKLLLFLNARDQNLRYVGLVATEQFVQAHPDLAEPVEEPVFDCLESKDQTIRHQALDVLALLVTRDNLMDVVDHLLAMGRNRAARTTTASGDHATDSGRAATSPLVLDRKTAHVILSVCTRDAFALVANFEWLVSTLGRLAASSAVGDLAEDLSRALIDLAMRVPGLRGHLISTLLPLLQRTDDAAPFSAAEISLVEAMVFICGEHVGYSAHPGLVLESLVAVAPRVPAAVHHPYVTAVVKVTLFTACAALQTQPDATATVEPILADARAVLTSLAARSANLLAVDRVHTALALLDQLVETKYDREVLQDVLECYLGDDLHPVAANAQGLIAPPMDLDTWISNDAKAWFEGPPEPVWDSVTPAAAVGETKKGKKKKGKRPTSPDLLTGDDDNGTDTTAAATTDNYEGKRILVQELQQGDPFYVKSPSPPAAAPSRAKAVLRRGAARAASPAPSGDSGKYAVNRTVDAPAGVELPVATPVLVPKPAKSSGGKKKKAKSSKAAVASPTSPSAKNSVLAEVASETADFSLSVELGAQRGSSAAAFLLPLAITLTPKNTFFNRSEATQVHVELPAWIKATGTNGDGTLLADDHKLVAPVKKLVLLKLRKAQVQDLAEAGMVTFRVLVGDSIAATVQLTLSVAHLLPRDTAMTPAEFETRLTGASRETEFAVSRTVTVQITAPTATAAFTALQEWSGMQMVEAIGHAASLWGVLDLGNDQSCSLAGMVKVALAGETANVTVEIKGTVAWVVESVCTAITRGAESRRPQVVG
ncbi:hypothetical protein AMAG_07310 [Allomyces macrogynus ATCC 38327]|uniref:Clathrin/coatomer adaptor adaptin-like N-terminal domain-containing protein n=1 Tax=Allomyces macrogynus (strain ATCC 38327) TaxID=578462 RepID=A0A0L0SHX9_ALLM3|nr:hypothetical protein AMAG_07310 [Allomyces macrogynus ATCC 38327]|eukprot:KNE62054.1 hypothetical protein AMAG_07310 [Allomyces macrogynus ATCC 38327]